MGVRLLSKINPADLESPASAFAREGIKPDDFKTAVELGTIIGHATGLSYRSNNFGDGPSIALTGIFEAIPVNTAIENARSPALFMPQAVQQMLVSALTDDDHEMPAVPKKGERFDIQSGKSLKICFSVAVRRADETGKYTFIVSHIGEIEKIDVLEALRLEVTTGKVAELPPPAAPTKKIEPAKPAKVASRKR